MTGFTGLKACALWLAILVLAILNGAFREWVLMPLFGNFAGLVASGTILSACIFLVAWAAVPWLGPLKTREFLAVGAFWLLLTLLFEFGFGRIVQHKTWAEMMEAYTFQGGNIWPVVLLVTCFSPWLAARLRHVT
jgi:hypothetical protein